MSKITSRVYYKINVILKSPLSVSGGKSSNTDADVLRNGSGEVFIPGTSLAGAFRNYIGAGKDIDCVLGFADEKKGKMSSIYISDLYFAEPNPVVSVRDGIKLTEEKQIEKNLKYDREIIETGATGTFMMELVIRETAAAKSTKEMEEKKTEKAKETEKKKREEDWIKEFLLHIQDGEIRFGANKNRGLGRLQIKEIGRMEFTKENCQNWIDFLSKPTGFEMTGYEKWVNTLNESEANIDQLSYQYIKFQIPLKLTGGISIRRYSAQPDKADFEHITCNGEPIIPGTSWNGAIRAAMRDILKELNCTNIEQLFECWFGSIEDGRKAQSQIVIGESILKGSIKLPVTRNQVNRLDASAGNLYSEIAWYGGTTELEIMIRKSENKSQEDYALAGALLLVIEDIQDGYVAVGGQTAVGHGIFEANGDGLKIIDNICNDENSCKNRWEDDNWKNGCRSAFYSVVCTEKGNGV